MPNKIRVVNERPGKYNTATRPLAYNTIRVRTISPLRLTYTLFGYQLSRIKTTNIQYRTRYSQRGGTKYAFVRCFKFGRTMTRCRLWDERERMSLEVTSSWLRAPSVLPCFCLVSLLKLVLFSRSSHFLPSFFHFCKVCASPRFLSQFHGF